MRRALLPRLVEPVPIEDTLCTGGLKLIEDVGFGARFVVCNEQSVYEDPSAAAGHTEFVIKGKLVLPWHHVWPGLVMTANFMARHAIAFPGVRMQFRRK